MVWQISLSNEVGNLFPVSKSPTAERDGATY